MLSDRIQSRDVILEAVADRRSLTLLLGALVVLMYLAATPAATKAWGPRCYAWSGRASFWMPSSGYIRGSVS